MTRIAVIGAGIGGLSAAARLAGPGREVTIFEGSGAVGGKAGERVVDEVAFDTGPSVLTLPEVFEDLFASCGERLTDHVTLRSPTPAFRYLWTDGTAVDVHDTRDATIASVHEALGADAARELGAFLDHARRIWEAAAPRFVFGPAVDGWTLLRTPPHVWLELGRVDPLRSMGAAITARVRSPHLRDLLTRYATYNGSDPRRAPGTLNCIAHVELAAGAYGVEGGIHRLARAVADLAIRRGAHLALHHPVDRIELDGARVVAVRLADGSRHPIDAVVVNADVGHVVDHLLPESARALPRSALSTSGWTAVVRSSAPPTAAHSVAFPSDYRQEFVDLFDRAAPPSDPTVYACDQTLAHGRPGWPDGARPVFLMANAPPEPDGGSAPDTWARLADRVLDRAIAARVILPGDPVVWSRSPRELAASFPGSRGALYGAASNGPLAAFRRAPNRVRTFPGLYLASGSAHPGGGLPLCASSGAQAAHAILADFCS